METRRKNLVKIVSYFCLALVAVIGFITIVASGGGGGGIKYTGVTTPASVDASNSEDLALGAYVGGTYIMDMADLDFLGAVQAEEEIILKRMNIYELAKVMNRAVEKADIGSQIGTLSVGATASDTIEGGCGGTANYKLNVNEGTGAFSGTFVFKNYCESDMIMNGKIRIEGTMNLNTFDMESFEMTFTNLTETVDEYSMTLDGSISMESSGSSITNTMDLKIKDEDDLVYWINNYVIDVTDNDTYVLVSATGRYYDPNYGYVDITTPTPLLIYGDDSYPSSGVFIVTGASSSARLEALTSETYQITADTDGDGFYDDYDSGVQYW